MDKHTLLGGWLDKESREIERHVIWALWSHEQVLKAHWKRLRYMLRNIEEAGAVASPGYDVKGEWE